MWEFKKEKGVLRRGAEGGMSAPVDVSEVGEARIVVYQ